MAPNRHAGRFAALSLGIVFALASAEGAGLIGNDYKGVLYDVNSFTGALSNPRPTGLANLCGIAYSADGTLYGFANSATNGVNPLGILYTINPTSGAATMVGAFGLADVLEGDLAFDPTTGKLYGIQDATPSSRSLFSINPATGVAADIGAVISGSGTTSDLSAMVFDSSGNLYIVDVTPSALLQVSKSTGAVISSVNLSLKGLGSTAGLAIDPVSGTAYLATGSNGVLASTDSLYTVNLSTGALTLVGALTGGTEGLAGLAFPPVAAPVLSITKTHAANFTQGQTNAQYNVSVTNSGGPTSGTVTVTESIPSGLTLVSMSGSGWNCSSLACTRSDVLGNSSYPPITATVNVAANAPSQVTNQVTVSGGGSPNATASDLTNINSTAAATVTNVTSSSTNGTYGAGSSISIQVTFSGPVTVTGTPQLALNSGGTANYTSGSGTATLIFSYTVGANDSNGHLDYASPGALILNGGTISANLTLPAPGTPGSLGGNNNITIGILVPAPFFTGQVTLGSGVEYLQFPNGNVFGFYNLQSFPIFYHYDLGFEGFIDGGNGSAYLYDFTSGHWFYTSPSLFPYLYDFTLQSWLYYFPDTKNPGRYTTNPRSFANLATGKIITM